MLSSVRDYPRDRLELIYADYADGIVAGARVEATEQCLFVGKGLLKLNGRLLIMAEDTAVLYKATGREQVLKARLESGALEGDFMRCQASLVLDEHTELRDGELELARFKLKEGARLRTAYRDFEDLATEYNTLHYVHATYAGLGRSTLHPVITESFASSVMKSRGADGDDLAFAMLVMNQGMAQRELLLHYAARRLGREYRELSNFELYRALLRILQLIQEGRGGPRGDFRAGGPQRMIVD
nr:DNA and RNA helicase [Paenibacillus turpanensis]